jgi:hypothetical protein
MVQADPLAVLVGDQLQGQQLPPLRGDPQAPVGGHEHVVAHQAAQIRADDEHVPARATRVPGGVAP